MTAVHAAYAGTIAVGGFSFLVSYTALSDLAEHFQTPHPWSFPLIVDGLVIVSTLAADVMRKRAWYAWTLLMVGAALSTAGNGLHAWITTGSPIAVGIAAVPPLVLLAVTHLTMMIRDQAEANKAATKKPVKRVPRKAPAKKPVAVAAAA
ncbi:DUF2637 domain-containing protein [Nocardia vulneris]|uniref:DUF2637 domain-containing protein n=1 Tax=Nocardia vulneris TaxID=1141657 RepID=UPI001FCDE8CF|nr:DUF2637 domain-containing protein [Nocardia vulneris]